MTLAEINALAAEIRGRIRAECKTAPEALAVLELVTAGTLSVALTGGNDKDDVQKFASGVLRRVRRVRAVMSTGVELQ